MNKDRDKNLEDQEFDEKEDRKGEHCEKPMGPRERDASGKDCGLNKDKDRVCNEDEEEEGAPNEEE